MQLWYHECMRVYYDRITNDRGRKRLKNILEDKLEMFSLTKNEVYGSCEAVIFSDVCSFGKN